MGSWPAARSAATAASSPASSRTTATPSLPDATSGLTTAGNPQAGHGAGSGTPRRRKSSREAALDWVTL